MAPAYDYQCSSCKEIWEETHPMKDYKLPCEKPCPTCKNSSPKVVRKIINSFDLVHDIKGPVSRMSNGFNEVLQRIKKNAGEGDTIRLK